MLTHAPRWQSVVLRECWPSPTPPTALQTASRIPQQNGEVLAELERLRALPDPVAAARQQRDDALLDGQKFEQLIQSLQVRGVSARCGNSSVRQHLMCNIVSIRRRMTMQLTAQQ